MKSHHFLILVKGAISVMLWLSQMSAAQSAAQQALFFNNFNTVLDAAAWLGRFFCALHRDSMSQATKL